MRNGERYCRGSSDDSDRVLPESVEPLHSDEMLRLHSPYTQSDSSAVRSLWALLLVISVVCARRADACSCPCWEADAAASDPAGQVFSGRGVAVIDSRLARFPGSLR